MQDESLEGIYRSLRLIRRTEEEISKIYPTDKIKSPVHLSIGQEFIAVGITSVLNDDDIVSGTYRGHAAYMAAGGSLNKMMAELFGKADGCAGGKGGSMHLVDMENHVLGCSAVVGTTIPVAVGYALATKNKGSDQIVVCFFGDGATEEGVFFESLNFASLLKLPVLFVCENNGLAIHAPIESRWVTKALCERVETFDIYTSQVADGNIFTLRDSANKMVENIRVGKGPGFIECMAYRWREHVGPNEDFDQGYRDRAELRKWVENDQMEKVGEMLDEQMRLSIDASIEDDIVAAIEYAEASNWPDPNMLDKNVFAG
ncbi:MAG: acetoin dehydrogenase [Magnetovibrio sp.]|nr:acetoin dehydrogenase [Magnetovibrio sp.]|tara:strand:- start:229 stop:1176 length:948 start_codon:yes stop_codon:yes gene_type:complete